MKRLITCKFKTKYNSVIELSRCWVYKFDGFIMNYFSVEPINFDNIYNKVFKIQIFLPVYIDITFTAQEFTNIKRYCKITIIYIYIFFCYQNLSQNQLGIEAAIQIGRMLKTNHTLQSLSLAANAFEDNIAELLAEPLEV